MRLPANRRKMYMSPRSWDYAGQWGSHTPTWTAPEGRLDHTCSADAELLASGSMLGTGWMEGVGKRYVTELVASPLRIVLAALSAGTPAAATAEVLPGQEPQPRPHRMGQECHPVVGSLAGEMREDTVVVIAAPHETGSAATVDAVAVAVAAAVGVGDVAVAVVVLKKRSAEEHLHDNSTTFVRVFCILP